MLEKAKSTADQRTLQIKKMKKIQTEEMDRHILKKKKKQQLGSEVSIGQKLPAKSEEHSLIYHS